MGVVVLVADQDALTSSSHAVFLIVLLESLQPRKYRGIFLWLAILRPERVVAEWVQSNRLRLVRVEVFGERGAIEALTDTLAIHSRAVLTGKSSGKLAALLWTSCA